MISRFSASYKLVFVGFTLLLVAACTSAKAQLLKKKSKEQADDRTEYAYQTYSTLKPKQKKSGYAGEGAHFQFEKPKKQVPVGLMHRPVSYTNFGHKHAPIRRSPGNLKFCKVCGIKH
jgi:hypothetical protein